MNEPYPWVTEAREPLLQTRVFSVDRQKMREISPEAKTGDFYVIRAPDWVNVVALTEAGDLVLIEQWRHGIDAVTLEIPGGMIDPGESPLAAAARELLEETGFTADEWAPLGVVRPNPAIQDNRCYTFLAKNARQTHDTHFDGNERCRLVLAPWAQVPQLIQTGKIDHALVVAGLSFARLFGGV